MSASSANGQRARAVRPYQSRVADGLSFVEGDLVEVLQMDDTGWWMGRCNGQEGLFPASRVTLESSINSALGNSSGAGQRMSLRVRTCVALYDFPTQEADELGFLAGDVITIVSKSKSGWWKGRLNGREGIFPANRVDEGGKPAAATQTSPRTPPAQAQPLPKPLLVHANETRAPSAGSGSHDYSPIVGQRSPRPERPTSPSPTSAESPPPSGAGGSASRLNLLSPRQKLSGFFGKLLPRNKDDGANAAGANSSAGEIEIAHPFEQQPAGAQTAKRASAEEDKLRLLDAVDTAAPASSQAPPLPKKNDEAERAKRHHNILMELIKTEEDYVRDVQMIVELFLVPVHLSGILSKTESESVFQNISHLIPTNQKLLLDLREQCALPVASQRIGRAFLNFTDAPIQQYSHYASQSQQSSQTLLALAKTNDRWAKFLNETYLNPKLRDLKLDTYLIKPVQRVCRYPLLLKELQSATPVDCVDAGDLRLALEKLSIVIRQINETRRQNENFLHQVELENGMRGLPADLKLAADNRKFVREALLVVMKGAKKRQRMFWMFNDCLVYGAVGLMGGYVFKGVVWYKMALVNRLADALGDEENAFELVNVDKKKTMVVGCSTTIQRDEWVSDLEARINKIREREAAIHRKERAEVAGGATKTGGGVKPKQLSVSSSRSGQGQGSVRMKGPRSARVLRLKGEMMAGVEGVELSSANAALGKVFSGHAAADWCQKRFGTDRAPALELLSGLLQANVLVPVLETPDGDFVDGFTAFYCFAGAAPTPDDGE